MRILLLGKNGQLGWELQRSLAALGEVTALDRRGAGGLVGDLEDLSGLVQTVRAIRPDVIVNAGAYTAVDRAESECELAQRINGEAPGVLAREAALRGAWLVHYSTDYVFDGSGSHAWAEDAATSPLSAYGRTKLAGEEAIRASGCKHLLLRTSWVYAQRGHNFAKTMLRLARERDALRVVADQIGAPTGAELLADVTAQALPRALGNPQLAGTYHVAAAGETSWFEYARFVIAHANAHGVATKTAPEAVSAITTADYPTPAVRPLNSRLDTRKLCASFGVHLPPWRDGVARCVEEGLL